MENFNTELDFYLVKSSFFYRVNVLNKKKTLFKELTFSSSFTLEEIYEYLKKEYPNKLFNIKICI
jgi:hypothetical protein